jgi:non-ribosomal peptide synthetase component F
MPVDPPKVRYRDFVARTRSAVDDPHERAFWADRTRDAVPTALPREPSDDGDRLGTVTEVFPDAVVAGLDRAARALRVPLSTVLLAGHVRALAEACAVDDVQTGLVMHGRPEEEGGVEVLGMYLNPLPLRVCAGTDRWPALVRRVHDAELELLPHRHFPYAEVDRIAGRPQFETVFEFRDFHVYREGAAPGPVRVVRRRIIEHTHVPLAANFVRTHPDRALVLVLNFRGDRHSAARVRTLAAGYRRALAALAAEAGDPA